MYCEDKDNLFVLMNKNSKKIRFFSVNTLNAFDFIPCHKNLIFYTTKRVQSTHFQAALNQKIIRKERVVQQNLKKLATILSFTHSLDHSATICDVIDNHVATNCIVYKACQFYKTKHYLHFRGLVDLSPRFKVDSITLIGGPCLFGLKDVFLETDQHQYYYPLSMKERRIPNFNMTALHLKNSYSLYEYESIVRQTSVVSAIIKALKNKCVITLHVDVPNIHYYFYFLNFFLHKKISKFLLLRWFEAIEQRSNSVYHCSINRVLKNVAHQPFFFSKTDSFKEIRSYLLHCIANDRFPHFQEVLTQLSQRGDPLWYKILSLKKPNNYQELTWLAYVLEEIKAAQPLQKTNHLAMIVENYPEWKIFNEAKKIIKKLNDPFLCTNMIGIYPLEKLIVAEESARSFALYANDWSNTLIDDKNKLFSYESLLSTIYN